MNKAFWFPDANELRTFLLFQVQSRDFSYFPFLSSSGEANQLWAAIALGAHEFPASLLCASIFSQLPFLSQVTFGFGFGLLCGCLIAFLLETALWGFLFVFWTWLLITLGLFGHQLLGKAWISAISRRYSREWLLARKVAFAPLSEIGHLEKNKQNPMVCGDNPLYAWSNLCIQHMISSTHWAWQGDTLKLFEYVFTPHHTISKF